MTEITLHYVETICDALEQNGTETAQYVAAGVAEVLTGCINQGIRRPDNWRSEWNGAFSMRWGGQLTNATVTISQDAKGDIKCDIGVAMGRTYHDSNRSTIANQPIATAVTLLKSLVEVVDRETGDG